MWHTFKGEILSQWYVSKVGELPIPMYFIFSKNKIRYTKELKAILDRIDFDPFQGSPIIDGTPYKLERVYHDDTDRPIYQITFGKDNKRYIKINGIERFKLMVIHDRLWIQKEPIAVIALIISIIALII